MLVDPYLRHKEAVISLSQEATMLREQPNVAFSLSSQRLFRVVTS